MKKVPEAIAAFLRGRRFAVSGVSRHPGQAANAVFRKLRDTGYEVGVGGRAMLPQSSISPWVN